jgi:hypothetical protein
MAADYLEEQSTGNYCYNPFARRFYDYFSNTLFMAADLARIT